MLTQEAPDLPGLVSHLTSLEWCGMCMCMCMWAGICVVCVHIVCYSGTIWMGEGVVYLHDIEYVCESVGG